MQGAPIGSGGTFQQSPTFEHQKLAETQEALQDALDQLQELAATNDSIYSLQDQLQQQSEALDSMQQSFTVAETQREQELAAALRR